MRRGEVLNVILHILPTTDIPNGIEICTYTKLERETSKETDLMAQFVSNRVVHFKTGLPFSSFSLSNACVLDICYVVCTLYG